MDTIQPANYPDNLTPRQKHMEWCKQRAMEYLDEGDTLNAWSSMASDLGKDEATANHPAIELGTMLLVTGELNDPARMKDFIEGFN